MMTQNERVLSYMKQFGSITQLDAFRDLGVMRLASRISDLRSQGVAIIAESEKSSNRYGESISYKRYRLDEKAGGSR